MGVVERVLGELPERRARRDDRRNAFLGEKVDSAVHENRRRGLVAVDARDPVDLASARVEARRDADVADHVELVADEDAATA